MFVTYLIICLLFGLLYVSLIAFILWTWNKKPLFISGETSFGDELLISVIIVARNEADNIQPCLKSLIEGTLPHKNFEIILVDDHSIDDTVPIAKAMDIGHLRILHLGDFVESDQHYAYKKKAIDLALSFAKGKYIALTDADCTLPKEWLSFFLDHFIRQNSQVLTAPVSIDIDQRPITIFQSLDIMGTMMMTAAGIHSGNFHLANGANMAYVKSFATALKAFDTNLNYASGDDVFFIQKAASVGARIDFLKAKEATVSTKPLFSWRSLFQQRIRWATKTYAYREKRLLTIASMIFIFYASILINLCLFPVFGTFFLYLAMAQIGAKLIADYTLLSNGAQFFGFKFSLRQFFVAFSLQGIFFLLVGISSLIRKRYIWKERQVN